ncbi:type IV secretion system DNA-binding domain-containing protein [uncultured Tateyamaria sp.]|uniref:type IV secretory system conjugative DNA transfer family protein n=1 Tax=uncultured Tateyamaria sp. TaxID=455651 RepID=UPI0026228652|nr:type IV secretion system DNA-binding domain-containing protein [uncultured Tateyamaria sp.]
MGQFDVELGRGEAETLTLSKAARDLHLQVVGLSGQGKSYFLEYLIRQDIKNGAGVCLIDPHGEVYDNLVAWLAANNLHKEHRIHLINPAMQKWSVGYNPLVRGSANVSTRVGAMIEACQHVWQDEASGGHATLAKLLDVVLSTLAEKRMSLREALLLTSEQYLPQRQELVATLEDPDLVLLWSEIDALGPRERAMRFEAVHNRLRDLTRTPVIKSMLGQTDKVLDFKTCMERGHIVLVNLAHRGRMKPQVAQMLGALITADLFYSAQSRDIHEAKTQPFYCYIDECGSFVNETVAKGLDETRKYGLHYVLSHQRLSQLGDKRSDPIRNAVVAGAQSKVVFLQEDQDTTNELGELLFGKAFDFERAKETLIKPTVVGYEQIILRGEGEAHGEFEGLAAGAGQGMGIGTSIADVDNPVARLSESEHLSEFSSESSGTSHVRSFSASEALKPILEDRPTATYSLEEQRHMAAMEIRKLRARQAFAYRADDRQAIQFATSDITPARPTSAQIEDFFDTIRSREPSAQPTADVEALITKRRTTFGLTDEDDEDPVWFSPDE